MIQFTLNGPEREGNRHFFLKMASSGTLRHVVLVGTDFRRS
jgi:hypothetical protein